MTSFEALRLPGEFVVVQYPDLASLRAAVVEQMRGGFVPAGGVTVTPGATHDHLLRIVLAKFDLSEILGEQGARISPPENPTTKPETEMTLKDMAVKLFEEAKAGKIGDALDTGAEFLKTFAGFYKLVFGTASASAEAELDEAEAYIVLAKAELCSCGDGSCKAAADAGKQAFDPTPWLMLADLLLKLIAERRKKKQP